jgi:3-mercaptopyruvate sulfurtransferase SseA
LLHFFTKELVTMNRTMMAISVFALFALTIIGMSCATSTQASKTQTEPAPVADAAHTEHEDDGVPRISAADAIALVKSGKALVIDTRDPTSFEAMHIAGAINVPYKEFLDKTNKALPKDKELIFYCT